MSRVRGSAQASSARRARSSRLRRVRDSTTARPISPDPRMSADSFAWRPPRRLAHVASRLRPAALLARPELLGLIGLTTVLNLWNLSVNGWANTYYSAAVRSMSTSWHDFLFAALDRFGWLFRELLCHRDG